MGGSGHPDWRLPVDQCFLSSTVSLGQVGHDPQYRSLSSGTATAFDSESLAQRSNAHLKDLRSW